MYLDIVNDKAHIEQVISEELDTLSPSQMYKLVNVVLAQVFAPYKDMKEAEKNKDIKKLTTIESQYKDCMKSYSQLLEHLVSTMCNLFQSAREETTQAIDTYLKASKEEQKQKEDIVVNLPLREYEAFHTKLYEKLFYENNTLDLIEMLVACYGACEFYEMNEDLNYMCSQVIKLCISFTKFAEVDSNQSEEIRNTNFYRARIEHGTLRSLMWTLSKISLSLMHVYAEPLNERNQTLMNLVSSNLLSGGIKVDSLNVFSEKTAKAIEDAAIITKDTKLIDYVKKNECTDEDRMLMNILEEGKDTSVDKLVELLAWEVQRKHIWAKSGGKDGMTITRSAFAVMVKFNRLLQVFEICLNEFELLMSTHSEDQPDKISKELFNELKDV